MNRSLPKDKLANLHLQSSIALTTRRKSTARLIPSVRSTSRTKNDYKPVKVIGKGAFGVVYCARASNGTLVAIKKVLQDPHYKNRELDILKLLHHKNCVQLKNSFTVTGSKPTELYLNIIMEYLPTSLHQFTINYRKSKKYPPIFFVKLFAFQMFAGLDYIHSIGITHRDIKPENILVNSESGELKICDFGSAKMLRPNESSVSYIASRYYRAPELILDCQFYTDKIDIWAAGCVIAEMLNAGIPLFQGSSSIGQLHEIIKILGPPNEAELAFPHNTKISLPPRQVTSLQKVLPQHTPPDILDLLQRVFVYNPDTRPSAQECMNHPCFDDLFTKCTSLPSGRPLPMLSRDDNRS